MTAIARLRTSAAPAFFALFALTACDEVSKEIRYPLG